ncbi:MAG: hypothetical protein AUK60_11865 [Rhodobacteraceae bacterium CG2_30_10_405]|nr:MAG: hypothetical protein AUK60_11865 [Rhodobacteraceae bacterium CG2_30_10_405]
MPEIVIPPPLWPFAAAQSVTEVLEWRTDVLLSRAGEQRIGRRTVPREIITYQHRLDALGLAQAAELARAGATGATGATGFVGEWLLPLWHMAGWPTARVVEGASEIAVDTTVADYRALGFAALAVDGAAASLIEIASVEPARLVLVAPLGPVSAQPIIAPVRRAIMTAPLSVSRRRQSDGILSATFTLLDGADLVASVGPQYLGHDVLLDPSLLRQPLQSTLLRAVEYVDNGFGPIAVEPARDVFQRGETISLHDYGPAARWARRRWLWSRRGRQRSFWLPTWGWEFKMRAAMTSVGTLLRVAPIADLTGYVGRHIMLDLPSGPLWREITGAVADGADHRLSIAAPGVPVPIATPVHWLSHVRLDADRVEIGHNATASATSFTVIEVAP